MSYSVSELFHCVQFQDLAVGHDVIKETRHPQGSDCNTLSSSIAFVRKLSFF